jgi:predicted ATPase/DNA-binding CsgD family transcriptional regulator
MTSSAILESVRERSGTVPLIGRDDDLAILDGWAAEARNGAIVGLLGGDAGMGKSRLVAEHVARATADGALVLAGGCLELSSGGLPYTPLAEAFRSLRRSELPAFAAEIPELGMLVPELSALRPTDAALPSGADPMHQQGRLLVGVRGIIEHLASTSPVELVLEDLHWADASTQDLLTYLVNTTEQSGLLILCTYRSDELHRRHPFRPVLAELVRSARVRHHVLEPLTDHSTRELVAELIGPAPSHVLDNVAARSGGNPFAVEVLAAAHKAGVTGLPAALGDVLMTRLGSFPEPVLDVLRAMAVVGRPVSQDLLVALTGAPEDDVEAALSAAIDAQQVVVDATDLYAFRHALLAEAVHGSTLPGQRRRLHRRFAEFLEEYPKHALRGGPNVEVASHWLRSGDALRGLVAAVQAVDEAAAMHSYAQAVELAEQSLELWPDVDDPEGVTGQTRVGLMRQGAEAAYLAGDFTRAERLVSAALELVDEAVDPVLAGRLTERVGRFRWAGGQPAERTEEAYRRAVQLIPPAPASTDRAQVLASLGQYLMLRLRLDEAVDVCQQALAMAREAGDELVEAHAMDSLGAALIELGDLTGVAYGRQSLEVARRLGHVDELARAYVNVVLTLGYASEWTEAIRTGYEGLQLARDRYLPDSYVGAISENLGRALLASGRFQEARSCVRAVRYAGSGPVQLWVILLRAELALLAGDPAAAQRELIAARALGAGEDPLSFHHHLATSAAIAGAQGNWGDVFGLVRYGLQIVHGETTDLRRVQVPMELARVLDDVPPGDARTELLETLLECANVAAGRIRERAGERVIPFVPVAVQEVRRRVADLSGDPGQPSWEDVAAAWQRVGHRIWEMRARIKAVERALEQGDRDRAEAAWTAARSLAETMDVPALAERLAAMGRRGRLAVERADAGDPYGLTPRELEVLGLLARGRTNPQIGKTLFISEKTASVHVSNILRKLAVANRAEAAGLALRKGLVS